MDTLKTFFIEVDCSVMNLYHPCPEKVVNGSFGHYVFKGHYKKWTVLLRSIKTETKNGSNIALLHKKCFVFHTQIKISIINGPQGSELTIEMTDISLLNKQKKNVSANTRSCQTFKMVIILIFFERHSVVRTWASTVSSGAAFKWPHLECLWQQLGPYFMFVLITTHMRWGKYLIMMEMEIKPQS